VLRFIGQARRASRRKQMNIIKEVRAAWVQREIKRLMPVSHKTEPVEQRRNPARAARKAAKKA
jgi:hypothetical protein